MTTGGVKYKITINEEAYSMSRKITNEKISPQCMYCAHGQAAADNTVLCPKRGVMQPYSSCKKFKYDPLKRQPDFKPDNMTFKPEDFML